MKQFRALTMAQWKGFWRDKQNLFWMLLFPLMFLLIFGSVFRDTGQSRTDMAVIGSVPLIEQMPPEGKAEFEKQFKLSYTHNYNEAIDHVRQGKTDAAVEMMGTRIILHYSQADSVKAATIQGTMSAFIDHANLAIAGVTPVLELDAQRVEDQSLKSIQFLTPGLLGWAIAMGACFGAAMSLVQWRQNKVLRRIRLAPVGTLRLVGSRTLVSMAVAIIQIAVFLTVATTLYGLKLTDAWWMSIPLALCGTLAFMALGLVAGAISKTPEGGSGLCNLLIMPMAFLSGSFIPLEHAPQWLITVSKFMPLRYLNEGMLDVMVRGQGPTSALPEMAVILAFAVAFALIAARIFRWEN